MIGENILEWVTTTLYSAAMQNEWIMSHYEAITGITSVVVISLVIVMAFAVVGALIAFFGRLLRW